MIVIIKLRLELLVIIIGTFLIEAFSVYGITGPVCSGKSTLINDTLYRGVFAKVYNRNRMRYGACDGFEGIENVDKIVNVSQEPIGRSPRSNPATYTGVFDNIRDVFASTKEAKLKGYDKGKFSFNVKVKYFPLHSLLYGKKFIL